MEISAGSCGRKVCSPTNYTRGKNTPPASGRPGAQQPAYHCYYIVFTLAIILITRALSGIDLVDDLYPSRLGLEYTYEMQQTVIWRHRQQGGRKILHTTHCIMEHATPDMSWTEISPPTICAAHLQRQNTTRHPQRPRFFRYRHQLALLLPRYSPKSNPG
jgi:hypothetical protein